MAITLYYEIQNTAILPDKVSPSQPASHPASIAFNDKINLSPREATAAPIQYKKVAPPSSPASVSSSILSSTSSNVNPLGILTIHDGKGQKDRTVPLPQTILPELRAHLESLKDLF